VFAVALVMNHTPLQANPDVIAKRLDDTTVLVHIPSSRIFELNETGSHIWEMIGKGLDADRIVQHLVDDFDVEKARAADEVRKLLERLRAEGLIVL
jgi:hypothetical protein